MLKAGASDILSSKYELDPVGVVKGCLRHSVAKMAYPKAIRPTDPLAFLAQLEALVAQDVDFQESIRARLPQLITEDSLKPGWQSNIELREIASAGTFTGALWKTIEKLLVTATLALPNPNPSAKPNYDANTNRVRTRDRDPNRTPLSC